MNNNNLGSNEKSIDDLIKISSGQTGKIKITSEEVKEKFDEKIKEIELKKKEQIAQERATQFGLGYVNLKGFPIGPEALAAIPKETAKKFQAICFLKTEKDIRIGTTDPTKPEIISLLAKFEEEERLHGELYLISDHSFELGYKLYDKLPKPRKFISGIEISESDLNRYKEELGSFRDLEKKIQKVSVTDMFTMIMAAAIQADSSDVHIEAEQEEIKIRFRIDGALYDVAVLPKKLWPKIISRVKLIAKLKLNINDVPQDGRFTIYLTNEFIDVRVSTVPSAHGESVVMRLLMSSVTGLELEDLGLVGTALDIVKKEIGRPNGMILTTGPTGSGKTSTLYAFLKKLNRPETKIITLENPIEYRLKGITQSQVETSEEAGGEDLRKLLTSSQGPKKHFTFASGLRAVLRQDPDIVMVGEVRDHETAEIAIQAALTGHLMLSTLHTNSAAGAIPRLLSMEVKSFLLAPALNMIIGQRLVRKICKYCKEEYTLSAEEQKEVNKVIDSIPSDTLEGIDKENFKFYKGKGCDKCNGIGYKGRVGIFEILTMNEEIEKLILTGLVSEYQIKEISQKHGMLTMLQDGILKAVKGITTIEEVFRLID